MLSRMLLLQDGSAMPDAIGAIICKGPRAASGSRTGR